MKTEQREIQRLKRKVAKLKAERDILKKPQPSSPAATFRSLPRLEDTVLRRAASSSARRFLGRPGPERGEIYATLHGELGTILDWTERQAVGKAGKTTKPAAEATGLLESLVAGVGFEPTTFRL